MHKFNLDSAVKEDELNSELLVLTWARSFRAVSEKRIREKDPGFNITLAVKRTSLYYDRVIKSFTCKETERIFHLESSKKFPPSIQQIALRKLRMLHRSSNITDLRIPPANRLEKLSGRRSGQWSIRVNNQWRICFEWHGGHAFKVEIVDYH
jgi:proteic killer suppression protein